MSGKNRGVSSLMYPYASDYMSQCSPFTIDFEVGDPICSSHYNIIRKLRNDSIGGQQQSPQQEGSKKSSSLVEYFESIRPAGEEGSSMQQLSLLIHSKICFELLSVGFITVKRAKSLIYELCSANVESTSKEAIRKRAERLLYDKKSKTALVHFIDDISFVLSSYTGTHPGGSGGSETSTVVDAEKSFLRYDSFKAGPSGSTMAVKLAGSHQVRRTYCDLLISDGLLL